MVNHPVTLIMHFSLIFDLLTQLLLLKLMHHLLLNHQLLLLLPEPYLLHSSCEGLTSAHKPHLPFTDLLSPVTASLHIPPVSVTVTVTVPVTVTVTPLPHRGIFVHTIP